MSALQCPQVQVKGLALGLQSFLGISVCGDGAEEVVARTSAGSCKPVCSTFLSSTLGPWGGGRETEAWGGQRASRDEPQLPHLGLLEFQAQAPSSLLQHPGGPAVHTPRDARQPLHIRAEGE